MTIERAIEHAKYPDCNINEQKKSLQKVRFRMAQIRK